MKFIIKYTSRDGLFSHSEVHELSDWGAAIGLGTELEARGYTDIVLVHKDLAYDFGLNAVEVM